MPKKDAPHIQTIRPDSEHLRTVPRANRPNQRETCVWVDCSCGWGRWLPIAAAQKTVASGACRIAAARRGYQTTLQRYGRDRTLAIQRKRHLSKPNAPERIIEHWLQSLGLTDVTDPDAPTVIHLESGGVPKRQTDVYERQCLITCAGRWWMPDFLIGNTFILEIDGYWHMNNPDRLQHDRALRAVWPYDILHLDTNRIHSTHKKTPADPHFTLGNLWQAIHAPLAMSHPCICLSKKTNDESEHFALENREQDAIPETTLFSVNPLCEPVP